MKKLSVKTKITIWYTVFLVLMTGGFITVLSISGNLHARELAKSRLTDSVNDMALSVKKDGTNFIFDKRLKFYDDGVFLSVYNGSGKLIEGKIPSKLAGYRTVSRDKVTRVSDGERRDWYFYDKKIVISDRNGKKRYAWVRGIVKDLAVDSNFTFMAKWSAVLFPALILIIAGGGFLIIRRGFKPIREILATVGEITKSGKMFLFFKSIFHIFMSVVFKGIRKRRENCGLCYNGSRICRGFGSRKVFGYKMQDGRVKTRRSCCCGYGSCP